MSLRDAFGVPLAVKRLERLPDGRVRVGMRRIWSDGTGALYGGVLAGNAAWRKEVTPKVPTSESAKAEARLALKLVKRRTDGARAEEDAPGWGEPLKRVFGVDGWQCPCCGKRMTLRTIVIGAPDSTPIVSGLLRAPAPPEGGGGGADRRA